MNNILVVDLDGTLTNGGEDPLKPHVKESLEYLRNCGWTLILATGRDRQYLLQRTDLKGIFDAWVTEAGLSVYMPNTGIYCCFVDDQWRMGIKKLTVLPFVEEKENTVAFRVEYVDAVKTEILKLGISAVFKNNKGAVILLPEGIDKAFGVKKALKLLNVEGPILVIVDAEVDLELFTIADFKAVVANAEQALKEEADYVATQENGNGVVEIIKTLIISNQK
ncbi:MAG: HAD hydrolase family protein [Candidatus Bathyarchaeales archaeon]